MRLILPAQITLITGMMTSETVPAGTEVTALMPGQQLAPGAQVGPGNPLVDVAMRDWTDYSFSPRLKVRNESTGRIGFIDRDTVIDFWFSPLVDGTLAATYCNWQLAMCDSAAFRRDFKSSMLSAMKRTVDDRRALLTFFQMFNAHAPTLRRVARYEDFRSTFEGSPIIIIRFYTGEQHGLLPNVLTGRYPVTGRLDTLSLLREQPPPIARARSTPVFDIDLHVGPRSSASTTRYGASAHGQGHTQGSPYVSSGPSLPNLIASNSAKLQAILFGKSIFPAQIRNLITYDQATHMGLFFVPGSMWRCEFTGMESRQEREVLYCGFDDVGYEGLWGHELFTLRNPFGHSYQSTRPVVAKAQFFLNA